MPNDEHEVNYCPKCGAFVEIVNGILQEHTDNSAPTLMTCVASGQQFEKLIEVAGKIKESKLGKYERLMNYIESNTFPVTKVKISLPRDQDGNLATIDQNGYWTGCFFLVKMFIDMPTKRKTEKSEAFKEDLYKLLDKYGVVKSEDSDLMEPNIAIKFSAN